MTSKNNTIDTIRQLLHNANNILLTSHIRPDGDAVGSLLGLGLALMAVGKDVQFVLTDGLPSTFKHLSGADQVITAAKEDFDLSVVVDCSDLERTGGSLGENQPDINIDHHITNLKFARHNLVEAKAATASIITNHLKDWDLPLTLPAAEALLTGMITDTIGFRTSNVTGETLRIASVLVDHGANISELYDQALVTRSYAETKLWGLGLSRLERDGRIVWTSLNNEDKKLAKFHGKGSADIINLLTSIDDADIAVVFLESDNHHIKVSWRAKPPLDISKLALSFGGGGHAAAAGADVNGTMEEVTAHILKATRAYLKNGILPANQISGL
ncbi:MAG: DHH family phosphoesterase [Anaerolineaceae bacterium]|nr:DHH family phosphoesterase [Anaerolineaceae bacterium]